MNTLKRAKANLMGFLFRVMVLMFLLVQTASCYRLKPIVRWSMLNKGSKVSLIGIPLKEIEEPFRAVWFKDRMHINPNNTQRYTTMKEATELLIHDFQKQDVGFYYFFYSNNITKKEIIFHLEMYPEEEPPWYSRNSTTVGTVVGLVFLFLIVVALIYYCCSKDADTGVHVFPTKQPMNIPSSHISHNMSFKYSGVKFTTQVTVPGKNSTKKKTSAVRRDSLVTLGLQSRENRSSIIYKNSRKKKPSKVVLFDNLPPSTLL